MKLKLSHTIRLKPKGQPKTCESCRTIIKALAEKRTEFQTYKLKEERSYGLEKSKLKLRKWDIRSQISGILNNTELRYHSMFFVELKPAPYNRDIFNVEYIYIYIYKQNSVA
jgi:hypothetical protein